MRKPSNNPITLAFGATTPPYTSTNRHKGTDFSYLPDNKIYAPFAGKATQAFNDRDGNGTYMTDPQGRFHGLLHASKYLVPNGANVKEGQAVAVMGDTGFAQGVHLHWAVKENGVFIDPMSLIKEEDEVTSKGTSILLLRDLKHVSTPTDKDIAEWTGLDDKQLNAKLAAVYNSAWFKTQTSRLQKYDGLVKENKALKEQLANGVNKETVLAYVEQHTT